jgi:enterochelin esterase-like enzyme
MDEAPMPAAPPSAQPRADATNSESSKGMRMAQAKSIMYGNTLVSNPCQRNRRLTTTSAKYTEERLQREERKQQQLAVASGPAPNANRTGGFGQ